MLAIEETGIIDSAHQLTVPMPASVPSGRHRVLVVIESEPPKNGDGTVDSFAAIVGAFDGGGGATGRHAEDVLYAKPAAS